MSAEDKAPSGPDLTAGVPLAEIADGGIVAGYVAGQPALLARRGAELFAVGAECTHYHGPLAEGLIVGGEIRCPWHHACFSLKSGEAVRAPALDPVPCWRVEVAGGVARVGERVAPPRAAEPRRAPQSVVIIGGGATGNAAAEMLRREGYAGPLTILSADDAPPCDRPNLSKDYLAGTAPEEWIPLRSPDFYRERQIDLRLGARVVAIDTAACEVRLADGGRLGFGALLLATGAIPVRLPIPGSDLPHVHYLRSLADSRALIAKAAVSRHAVVVGASFIGLEVAASLRARGLDVAVVAPEARPMERILGPEVGDFVRQVHQEHGVEFHLGTTPAAIDAAGVSLNNGKRLAADLVVIGVGVHPEIKLAADAGVAVDRGVAVDAYLETSVPGIFAAGDIARWPDPLSGERIRIEHWVVAERQGQTAARNMLGRHERFAAVPFFWSQHYDTVLSYVGHAAQWDRTEIDGSLAARDCAIGYFRGGRKLAVLTVGRDRDSLKAEAEFEGVIARG
jgi:apoptosis-inducing factor 3